MRSTLLRLASTSLLAIAVLAPAQVKTQNDSPFTLAVVPIPVRAGDGSAVFTIANNSSSDKVTLTAGPVVDSATHAVLSRTKVTIAPVVAPDSPPAGSSTVTPSAKGPSSATSTLAISIPVGEKDSYQINIAGLSGASVAEVELFVGSTSLGTLPVIAVDAPLAIAIDGDGASTDKPLDFPYDNPATVALKNSDTQPYHVGWTFEIDGKTMAKGTVDIGASGTSRIPLKGICYPHSFFRYFLHLFSRKTAAGAASGPCQVYSPFIDRVHATARKGLLLFSVLGPAHLPSGLLPVRTLPVSLVLHGVSPTWTTVDTYFYAGILLFLGGSLSVFAGSVLPNMQKAGDLRSQIRILAHRTTSVSTRIDSYLRVLLRLERRRIEDTLDNVSKGYRRGWIRFLLSLISPEALIQVTAATDTLTKRLTAAERLDDLRRKHDQVAAMAPPSVTDSIDAYLQAAADQLHSLALSDADLAAVSGFLAKAQASLDMLNDSDALAKLIAGNFTALTTRLDRFPPGYCTDLKDALPGIFVILDATHGYNDPKNLVRPMFFAVDHGIAAIHLALDYAMVRASIPVQVAPAPKPLVAPDSGAQETGAAPISPAISIRGCDQLGAEMRERLKQHHCKLIELLGTLSWRALREATLLVQEMRENTYEEDVLEEMTKSQAEITFDTQTPRPFSPVFFSITFRNAHFNDAAALQRLICHWTFPDGLEERCWNACHYFTGNEKVSPAGQTSSAPSATKSAPNPVEPSENPEHGASLSTPMVQAAWYQKVWPLSRRYQTAPRPVDLLIRAAVRGQTVKESEEVPIPPLERCIKLQMSLPKADFRVADVLRFLIAFGVALAGLVSGALDQLGKLDFIPASIAIVALGFGANSVKNLLTDSAAPQAPAKK